VESVADARLGGEETRSARVDLGIGNQIAQALALAAAFVERQRAERVAEERAELLRASEGAHAQLSASRSGFPANGRSQNVVGINRPNSMPNRRNLVIGQPSRWGDQTPS
jgi:hypothetical protein